MIEQYISIRQGGGGSSIIVSVSDDTPDVGDTITISTITTGFAPTQYEYLLFNGSVVLLAQQSGGTLNWTVNAVAGTYEIYVLATDGVISAFGKVGITANGLLFDFFPSAIAGYSLRKLRKPFSGSAARFRKSSDNTEQDIGFTSDVLDTSSLLSFVDGGDGFVTRIYDQSVVGYNLSNTSAINQPQVVSSGVVDIQGIKPTMTFGGARGLRINVNQEIAPALELWFYMVLNITDTTTTQVILEQSSNFNNITGAFIIYIASGLLRIEQRTGTYCTRTTPITTGYKLISIRLRAAVNNANFAIIYINGTPVQTQTSAGVNSNPLLFINSPLNFGSRTNNTLPLLGTIQELIMYKSDQSDNRLGIENNINSFYNIY